jgi:hypothetical protein
MLLHRLHVLLYCMNCRAWVASLALPIITIELHSRVTHQCMPDMPDIDPMFCVGGSITLLGLPDEKSCHASTALPSVTVTHAGGMRARGRHSGGAGTQTVKSDVSNYLTGRLL